MRILLLGTGYIGTLLISSWENHQDQLVAVTTSEEKVKHLQSNQLVEDVILLKVDGSTDLNSTLDNCDAVIVTVAPKNGASYQQTYVGCAKAVKQAVNQRERPLYILYTGSTSVYGNQEGERVTEESERSPLSESSTTLCEAEDIFLSCSSKNVDVCVLRLGGIYGPGRTLEKKGRKNVRQGTKRHRS